MRSTEFIYQCTAQTSPFLQKKSQGISEFALNLYPNVVPFFGSIYRTVLFFRTVFSFFCARCRLLTNEILSDFHGILSNYCEKFEIGLVQKCANMVDLKKCCKMSTCKIGLGAAENGPSPVLTRRPKSTHANYACSFARNTRNRKLRVIMRDPN